MISHTQVLARGVECQCRDSVLLWGEGRGCVAQTLHQLEGPLTLTICQMVLPTFGLRPLACVPFFIVLVKALFFDGPEYPDLILISDDGYASWNSWHCFPWNSHQLLLYLRCCDLTLDFFVLWWGAVGWVLILRRSLLYGRAVIIPSDRWALITFSWW